MTKSWKYWPSECIFGLMYLLDFMIEVEGILNIYLVERTDTDSGPTSWLLYTCVIFEARNVTTQPL